MDNSNGGNWSQIGGDIDGEAAGDDFGRAVSLSDDGETLAIGAPVNNNSGHVRVYKRDTSEGGANGGVVWNLIGGAIIGEAADEFFGFSVSLSGDGETLAIGATFNAAGHVRVYKRDIENINGGNWSLIGGDINGEAAGDQFGYSVSLSGDGKTLAIGANFNDIDENNQNRGHVRVYTTDLIPPPPPPPPPITTQNPLRNPVWFKKFASRDSINNIIQIRGFNPLTKKFLNLGSSQSEYIKYKKVKKSINVFNN
jgi:hypothetical protein